MMRWWDNDVFVKRRSASEEEVHRMREELIREEDEHIANESQGTRKHTFRVSAETRPLERVGITGSCVELGSWDPERVVLMNRDGDSDVWTADVLLPLLTNMRIRYRYVVVTDENYTENRAKTGPSTIKSIRRWELTPGLRKIEPIGMTFQATASFRKEYLQMNDLEIRTMRREKTGLLTPLDEFGTVAGQHLVRKGWLTVDNALQVILSTGDLVFSSDPNSETPIFTKLRAIKVFKSGLENDDFCEDLEDGWPVIVLSVLNEKDASFRRQDQFGYRFCRNECAIYHIFHEDSKTLGIVFDFYVYKKRHVELNEPTGPVHIGFAVFHPCLLWAAEGESQTEICNIRGATIGLIKINYSLFKNASPLKFRFNYSLPNHWKKIWTAEDPNFVGPMFRTCAEIRDNTLAAVEDTVALGFDFVEIPLQLTKDGIPIFCHSPYIVVGVLNPNDIFPMDQFQVRVSNFTLPQLHRMRVNPVQDCNDVMKLEKNYTKDVRNRPFPTMMQLLNGVSKHVGFVVEVNSLMLKEDGTYPRYHDSDVNELADRVLKTLQQSAGRRRIILTSFLPNVCSMLKLKQNAFPVIFLHDGIPGKLPRYGEDIRCSSLEKAIHYATSMELEGIGVLAEELVKDSNALLIGTANLVAYTTRSLGTAQRQLRDELSQSTTMNVIECTREDEAGVIRRTLGYVIEPKGRERRYLGEWADEAAVDGFQKPDVRPLDHIRSVIVELDATKELQPHRKPAGLPTVQPRFSLNEY